MKPETEAKLDLLATKLMEAQELIEELMKGAPPEAGEELWSVFEALHDMCNDKRAMHASGSMCVIAESFKTTPVWPAEEA